jgi:hypothetical protein
MNFIKTGRSFSIHGTENYLLAEFDLSEKHERKPNAVLLHSSALRWECGSTVNETIPLEEAKMGLFKTI